MVYKVLLVGGGVLGTVSGGGVLYHSSELTPINESSCNLLHAWFH